MFNVGFGGGAILVFAGILCRAVADESVWESEGLTCEAVRSTSPTAVAELLMAFSRSSRMSS